MEDLKDWKEIVKENRAKVAREFEFVNEENMEEYLHNEILEWETVRTDIIKHNLQLDSDHWNIFVDWDTKRYFDMVYIGMDADAIVRVWEAFCLGVKEGWKDMEDYSELDQN